MDGGEGGIRTLGTLARSTVFETAPIDHSGTSPHARPSPLRAARSNEPRALAQAPGLAKREGPPALAATGARPYIGTMTAPDHLPPDPAAARQAPPVATARFTIGDVVRHRLFDFRGVIFDVDPVFANSEEWYQAIPEEIRPAKDQPFYHLLAENAESSYVAYVSQQNLIADDTDEPIDHPAISGLFTDFADGRYQLRREHKH